MSSSAAATTSSKGSQVRVIQTLYKNLLRVKQRRGRHPETNQRDVTFSTMEIMEWSDALRERFRREIEPGESLKDRLAHGFDMLKTSNDHFATGHWKIRYEGDDYTKDEDDEEEEEETNNNKDIEAGQQEKETEETSDILRHKDKVAGMILSYLQRKSRSSSTSDDEDPPEEDRRDNLSKKATDEESWLLEQMRRYEVQWLPPLVEGTEHHNVDVDNVDDSADIPTSDQMSSSSSDSHTRRVVVLPMFPLYNARVSIPPDPTTEGYHTAPVAGNMIPLRIFEPRYRQMYHDVMKKKKVADGENTYSRCFVVPFGHPTKANCFAQYGWLYQIVSVQDIADESNGQYLVECQHIVTKPVKIHSILNPQDWFTQETYLSVEVEILDDTITHDDNDSAAAAAVGEQWNWDDLPHFLRPDENEKKSVSVWDVTEAWIGNLKHCIAPLRLMTNEDGEEEEKGGSFISGFTRLVVQVDPAFRDRIWELQLQTRLLVPRLLQLESNQERIDYLQQTIIEEMSKREAYQQQQQQKTDDSNS